MRVWLKDKRVEAGLTQEEVGNAIGVTRQMVGIIENGGKPSVDTAIAIGNLLDFNWTLLFSDLEKQAIRNFQQK